MFMVRREPSRHLGRKAIATTRGAPVNNDVYYPKLNSSLELRLGDMRLDGLHEPEARLLHRGNRRLLVLLELLVLLLELVHFVREELLRFLDLRLLLLDLLVQIRGGQLLQLEDLLLHLRLAKVHLRRAAHRLQALGELLKRCEVPAPLVVLEAVRIAVPSSP